ncbi:Flagellar basal body rod protein FlgB [Bythopirellula goksoeyrii]|uniref:Flagellar basal body rod protein FlgB n=2 Tax=Bythopirellula goksoeyrii TaxID=1400387 RepID=A0A5B9Q5U6_9BACT|nr:Flagellar basal body rod protein FlgB [Bythopirellula goksoeyrii]
MLSSMFESSTVPLLEQVVNFTQSRHGVLAGNIANIDTPGYKSRDLSVESFQTRLQEAVDAKHQAAESPTYALNARLAGRATGSGSENWDRVRETAEDILYHDNHDVSLETQVTEISKNQVQHNMALTIMNSQFRLLRAAVTERV